MKRMDISKYTFDCVSWTSVPVCPFCGHECPDWWDARTLQNDGDTDVFTCGHCEKEYEVTMSVDVSFKTTRYSKE